MQASSVMQCKINIEPFTFRYMCKKLGIKHYSTNEKYNHIEYIWNGLLTNITSNITYKIQNISTASEMIIYLYQMKESAPLSLQFTYDYIIRELHNYDIMSQEFASDFNTYIRRLKGFAKNRKCNNMSKLKHMLNKYLITYTISDDETSKNDIIKRDWLILSRYICDFIEDNNSNGNGNCNGDATTDTNTKFELF